MSLIVKASSKYRSKKSGGFDSKKEARRHHQLVLMMRAGLIKDLQKQAPFILLESFKDSAGKTERGVKYLADFVYYDIERQTKVIEDVKSEVTKKIAAYVIKRKLVKKLYPDYLFLET
jgi:hypothetical protein